MKVPRSLIAVAAFVIAFLLPAALAQSSDPTPKSNEMSLWRARRALRCDGAGAGANCAKVTITDDAIDWDISRGRNKSPEHYSLDLKSLDKLTADCRYHGFGKGKFFTCEVHTSIGKPPERHTPLSFLFTTPFRMNALAGDTNAVQTAQFLAEVFVTSLNRLHENAIHPESPLRNFSRTAAEWRALPIKPDMPSEARVHRLLAEDEVKQKHPALALYHYESALELYPTWPEGYFNAALIAAEEGLHAQAAEHMQSYLELVPNAPDAQTARDQVAVWQYKAKSR